MQGPVVSGIRPSFPGLSQSQGQVAHVLLTRSPLEHPQRGLSARLACVKHAASVRPEPGSNSPTKTLKKTTPANTKTFANKTIGTGLSDTLLSSQKTTTHQKPTTRPALGALVLNPGRLRRARSTRSHPASPGYVFPHRLSPLPDENPREPCRPADDRRSDPSARLLPAV